VGYVERYMDRSFFFFSDELGRVGAAAIRQILDERRSVRDDDASGCSSMIGCGLFDFSFLCS